jgi:hypothetical protein
MKKLLLVVLAVFSASAFATGLVGQEQAQGQAQSLNVSNRISNDVRANANAFAAAQASAKSNAQNLTTTDVRNNTGGNSLTVNEAPIPAVTSNTTTYGGEYTVKTVPAVVTGNVYPTAPCMGSSAIGGSGVGFGFSIGSSWKDDECGIRETARSFNGMGLKEDALKVLCTSAYAAAAPSCAPKGEVK